MSFTITEDDKQVLLTTARRSIENKLHGGTEQMPPPTEILQEKCGAFVTLKKQGKLRGCIGHMTGVQPLHAAVAELARSSAFHDPRFPPLAAEELDKIDIEITVLTPLEEISDPSVIEIGKHGIYLKRGGSSGVLLPQVAVEQGWDRNTFLEHTCRKAGLPGNCWKDRETKLHIFEGIIFGET
jgi:uncharacterized protein